MQTYKRVKIAPYLLIGGLAALVLSGCMPGLPNGLMNKTAPVAGKARTGGSAVVPNTACPSGYEVVINGGRKAMGMDAIAWARRGCELGAGEVVVNSIDADGMKQGYELKLTRMVAEAIPVPVVASGGAGTPEHLHQVLTEGKADAALVASMVHYGDYRVLDIKQYLNRQGVKVRMNY